MVIIARITFNLLKCNGLENSKYRMRSLNISNEITKKKIHTFH